MKTVAFFALAVVLWVHFVSADDSTAKVSAKKSLVWGPGLNRHVATPARYIYIQARTSSGRNITTSPGINAFTVKINIERDGRLQPLTVQMHDRADGSFLALFWYNVQPTSMTIEVICNVDGGKHVGKSPFRVDSPEIEACYCPRDHNTFMSNWQCSEMDRVRIGHDFLPFPKGSFDRERLLKAIDDLDNDKNCFIHYVFKDNQLYGKAYGPHQGFKKFSDEYFLSLMRRVHVPDVEFLLNLGDWPLGANETADFPIISWCGSTETNDLVLPTYKVILGSIYGRDVENIAVIDGSMSKVPRWKDKIPRVFWRGRDSNSARVKLVFDIAPQHPHLFDAKLSKNHFNYYPTEEDRKKDIASGMYAKKVERVDMVHYFQYKYLLNIDGTVAAYRYPALIAGDSVTFLQESKYYEHFYSEMKPFVHYIPVKNDLSDLVEKIQWAIDHDSEAEKIAKNARDFARNRLRVEDAYCFYYQMFLTYAAHQSWKPLVSHGVALVPQEPSNCRCGEREGMRSWPLEEYEDERWKKFGDVDDSRSHLGKIVGGKRNVVEEEESLIPPSPKVATTTTKSSRDALLKGKDLLVQGKFKDCVVYLRNQLGDFGDDADVHSLLGDCLAKDGDTIGEEIHRNYAVSLNPNSLEKQSSLAALLISLDRIDEAMKVWEAASAHPNIGKQGLLSSASIALSSPSRAAAARSLFTSALPLLSAKIGLSLLPPLVFTSKPQLDGFVSLLLQSLNAAVKDKHMDQALRMILSGVDRIHKDVLVQGGPQEYLKAAVNLAKLKQPAKPKIAQHLEDFITSGMIEYPSASDAAITIAIALCDPHNAFIEANLQAFLQATHSKIKTILLVTESFSSSASISSHKTLRIPSSFTKSFSAIEAINPHILLYAGHPSSDPWSSLFFSRVSPVQILFTGENTLITSGNPYMDHIIGIGSQSTFLRRHLSEALITIPTVVPINVNPSSVPGNPLPQVLLCGCSAASIPLSFDPYIVTLLKHTNFNVVFVESDPLTALVYKQRLGELYGDATARINPASFSCNEWIDHAALMSLVIDPIPYGDSGLHSLLALSRGIPVIVGESSVAAAMASQFGLEKLVASSNPDGAFASQLNSIINQRQALSQQLVSAISSSKSRFLGVAQKEWENKLLETIESKFYSPIN